MIYLATLRKTKKNIFHDLVYWLSAPIYRPTGVFGSDVFDSGDKGGGGVGSQSVPHRLAGNRLAGQVPKGGPHPPHKIGPSLCGTDCDIIRRSTS